MKSREEADKAIKEIDVQLTAAANLKNRIKESNLVSELKPNALETQLDRSVNQLKTIRENLVAQREARVKIKNTDEKVSSLKYKVATTVRDLNEPNAAAREGVKAERAQRIKNIKDDAAQAKTTLLKTVKEAKTLINANKTAQFKILESLPTFVAPSISNNHQKPLLNNFVKKFDLHCKQYSEASKKISQAVKKIDEKLQNPTSLNAEQIKKLEKVKSDLFSMDTKLFEALKKEHQEWAKVGGNAMLVDDLLARPMLGSKSLPFEAQRLLEGFNANNLEVISFLKKNKGNLSIDPSVTKDLNNTTQILLSNGLKSEAAATEATRNIEILFLQQIPLLNPLLSTAQKLETSLSNPSSKAEPLTPNAGEPSLPLQAPATPKEGIETLNQPPDMSSLPKVEGERSSADLATNKTIEAQPEPPMKETEPKKDNDQSATAQILKGMGWNEEKAQQAQANLSKPEPIASQSDAKTMELLKQKNWNPNAAAQAEQNLSGPKPDKKSKVDKLVQQFEEKTETPRFKR